MPNRKQNRGSSTADSTQVVSKRKHGPIITDGSEVRIQRVGKYTVVDELSTRCYVTTCLICGTDGLWNIRNR